MNELQGREVLAGMDWIGGVSCEQARRDQAGMAVRREFSAKIREQAAKRANGKCEECGRRLLYGEHKFEFDHIVPLGLGGLSDDGNIRVVCKSCHSAKTKVDIHTIAKAKRNFRRAAGIKKSRHSIPGSRDSKWKKCISGKVILRGKAE